MLLSEFCRAIGVPAEGPTSRIHEQPHYLKVLYARLCHDDWRESARGKFGSIQFPVVRYFGYLIARCILARHITSNIYGTDLAILAAAIDNDATYNIGALIASHLSTNNKRGPIYGGIFASIMLSFVGRKMIFC